MKNKTLMVQGTTSDAGKSTLVAGLCRVLARKGYAVAPFKPQNMALNSAVTPEGGEIGRAQAVQALAAGIPPHVDMNPILLKPNSDTGAQVIIHGRAISNMEAASYHDYKQVAWEAVRDSHQRLVSQYQAIIVEGAGSPAEINLREHDLANMGFAERVDCPVILIADIDKGGVFAHIVGTLALLSETEQARIKGFVINRFRGDFALLESGLQWLEDYTKKPVLGVLPYLHGFHLEAEDAVCVEQNLSESLIKVAVLVFPHISNHTDFDPLRLHPDIDLVYVGPHAQIPAVDLIILPGSKSVRHDLAWLKQQGWDQAITKHLRYGGKLLGICGGYQMLGMTINDPDGIEGESGESKGLALLDFTTQLHPEKQLMRRTGQLRLNAQRWSVSGYEIHCGISQGPALAHAIIEFDDGSVEGALSEDGQILGTYLHGIFEEQGITEALLTWLGRTPSNTAFDYRAKREQEIDRLADTLEAHLDIPAILQLMETK